MKRSLVLIAAALAVTLATATPRSAQECGDVDDSGAVAATDASLVLRRAVGQNVSLICPGCAGDAIPIQGQGSQRLLATERTANFDLFTPPQGKLAVIEYVTIQVFAREQGANALITLSGSFGGKFHQHYLGPFPPPVSVGVVSAFQQILQEQVRMYSTGQVSLSIDRGNLTSVVVDYDVSFSGYLIDAPAA